MPTFLDTMKYWFRVYKVPDGKGENEIAMGAEVMDRLYALHLLGMNGVDDDDDDSFAKDLIESCHGSWQTLLKEPGTQHKDKSALYAPSPHLLSIGISTNQAQWIQTEPASASKTAPCRRTYPHNRPTTRSTRTRTKRPWTSRTSSRRVRSWCRRPRGGAGSSRRR